ncbi:hypothetical protein [Alkalihalobacterium chitinilyticum]|uniref:Uncharacterized protein n=1 Tax=Alkalihalobacterium chitinilyticum TaxID=2980103 RepID=A0ABT5VKW2_9BACI|nr:hypothetical protein [Alkalihalobacterium chitinilyticum]MDE5415093.1 hypothetical protein [Alkalihalobacterium chitinilyticum]
MYSFNFWQHPLYEQTKGKQAFIHEYLEKRKVMNNYPTNTYSYPQYTTYYPVRSVTNSPVPSYPSYPAFSSFG